MGHIDGRSWAGYISLGREREEGAAGGKISDIRIRLLVRVLETHIESWIPGRVTARA